MDSGIRWGTYMATPQSLAMARRTVSKLMVAAAVLPTILSAQIPVSSPLSAQTGKGPFTGDFNSHVEGLMDEWKLAGMAVAVIDGDDVFTEVSSAMTQRDGGNCAEA